MVLISVYQRKTCPEVQAEGSAVKGFVFFFPSKPLLHYNLQRIALQARLMSWVSVVMAKVFTIPVLPDPTRRRSRGPQTSDPRYIEGQRLLVEAMKYLAQQDPAQNRDAVMLLSEHFRTRFRMTDRPDEIL